MREAILIHMGQVPFFLPAILITFAPQVTHVRYVVLVEYSEDACSSQAVANVAWSSRSTGVAQILRGLRLSETLPVY